MARLQILILPAEKSRDGTETTPFALVLDEVDEELAADLGDASFPVQKVGARALLVFSCTVDVL